MSENLLSILTVVCLTSVGGCAHQVTPEVSESEVMSTDQLTATMATVEAPQSRCGLQENGDRTFVTLHINDVSRIGGLMNGDGGLARVRSLRVELEEECGGDVMLTNGGDSLFPSLLSREFEGRQMVDVLSMMDGDVGEFDPFQFSVFGNSDFEMGRLSDAVKFSNTIAQSQFSWLTTNVRWVPSAEISEERMAHDALVELHGLKVGLYGVTTGEARPAYGLIDGDYRDVSVEAAMSLRERGADVVIALTHLDQSDDTLLLEGDLAQAPDVIFGGQHEQFFEERVNGRWILRGGADATSARVAWVTVAADGEVSIAHELVDLSTGDVPGDVAVEASVETWWRAFDSSFCGAEVGCLHRYFTQSRIPLEGTEDSIRGGESSLGNLVADSLRASFDDADIGVVNAGALRLNQVILSGAALTRQFVEETIPYENIAMLISISGERLFQVLSHSVSEVPSPRFLQVSGLALRYGGESGELIDVAVLDDDGFQPLDLNATYRIALPRYLVDGRLGNQDGYGASAAGGLSMVDVTEEGIDMRAAMIRHLLSAGDEGVAPSREGRICSDDRAEESCLVVSE